MYFSCTNWLPHLTLNIKPPSCVKENKPPHTPQPSCLKLCGLSTFPKGQKKRISKTWSKISPLYFKISLAISKNPKIGLLNTWSNCTMKWRFIPRIFAFWTQRILIDPPYFMLQCFLLSPIRCTSVKYSFPTTFENWIFSKEILVEKFRKVY